MEMLPQAQQQWHKHYVVINKNTELYWKKCAIFVEVVHFIHKKQDECKSVTFWRHMSNMQIREENKHLFYAYVIDPSAKPGIEFVFYSKIYWARF